MRTYPKIKYITRACVTCKKEFTLPDWKQYRHRTACRGACCPRTKAWKEKLARSKLSEKNPQWKERPTLVAIHKWVLARKPKPKCCEDCKKAPPRDLANISQEYKRDVNDFEWLCRRCHMTKDGRLAQVSKIMRDRALPVVKKTCQVCKKEILTKRVGQRSCSPSCSARLANMKRWGTAYRV